ncbi:LysE family translocator [Actinoplanes sp. NPDC026619]|uniref:LysE family translocator n=1 Tax=Actinoplanes sp. NPDC026619 TaxID=3155798 RepID=UPI0033FFEFA4
MTGGQVLGFAGVIVLGAMSPGPDFAVVVRRAAIAGRRGGMAAAAGVAAGIFGWAAAAAAGVAAMLSALPAVLEVVRYAGAGYLAYLGVRALIAAIRRDAPADPGADPGAAGGRSTWLSFRDGLLCNVLNPKAAVFFVALLPQFVPSGAGVGDVLVLSLVAVGVTLAWFFTVANLIAALRRFFARPVARRGLEAATGTALLGLGARLALTR